MAGREIKCIRCGMYLTLNFVAIKRALGYHMFSYELFINWLNECEYFMNLRWSLQTRNVADRLNFLDQSNFLLSKQTSYNFRFYYY